MMSTRCIVILIAVWTVIQGFAYGIMSILALLAHDCQLPMTQSRVSYLMYIIFFRDRKCGPIRWNIVTNNPPLIEPAWPPDEGVTHVAFRTNIIALVFLLLSTIWIITSLMLIVGCFMSCLGRVAYYLLMMPWAVFCTITSIFDVVAVVFFFYDLFNTLNTDSFVRHLHMQNTSSNISEFMIDPNILPIPAVIMLIVAGRGFIFWCLNILSIPIILSYARNILYRGKQTSDSSDEHDFHYARSQAHGNNNILENHFPTDERSRYSDPSYYHQYQQDNLGYNQDKYDSSRTIGRRYIEPLKDQSFDESDNHLNKRAMANSRNSSQADKSSKKSSWSDDSDHSNNKVINNITQNNGKSYNWKELSTDAVLKIERPHFRLPHKPSLLKKLSDSSFAMPVDEPNQQSIQYTGEELRGQLPWSYFSAQSDVIKPKKSFIELRDDEDLPPVPVPDYTMKFPLRDRSGENVARADQRRSVPAKKFINPKKSNRSHWSGPEYRY